ncbi:methyltransferase domain-containing protein [Nocardioides sp.]|uniref:methyltransferase domain-containing protein n=1 Tax=Nocardioides sp. TaxID=35761 RepID=UPI00286C9558|nr:methyltransferase domain-containing protein [Nocardioides sp.]
MPHGWDPQRYLTYADERGRPFVDLLARIDAADPQVVVDLGCGPGNLTRLLADRWPGATVSGLDSSPEMIAAARAAQPAIAFGVADLTGWSPEPASVDVLVSNATLQWVPGHRELLAGLLRALRPGGWFAFQVPANVDQPSHTLRAELADLPPYDEHTGGIASPASHDAAAYLETLSALGCEVDAWETTYLHVLRGEDPVFTWVSATGARPTLEALPDDLRADFERDFKQRLREAYPARDGRVVLPFRRVLVVAQVPA